MLYINLVTFFFSIHIAIPGIDVSRDCGNAHVIPCWLYLKRGKATLAAPPPLACSHLAAPWRGCSWSIRDRKLRQRATPRASGGSLGSA